MVVEFRISLFKLFYNLGPISETLLGCCLGTSNWPDPEDLNNMIIGFGAKHIV